MKDLYQEYRLRDLFYTVDARERRLSAEGWLRNKHTDLVTRPQWQSWRKRVSAGVREEEAPARIVRSAAQIPPVRIKDDARVAHVTFPLAVGYRVSGPDEPGLAEFDSGADFMLTRERVETARSTGDIGSRRYTDLELQQMSPDDVGWFLANHSVEAFRKLRQVRVIAEDRFYALRQVYEKWLIEHVKCESQTSLGYFLYQTLADEACQRVMGYLTRVDLITQPAPMYSTIDLDARESDLLGVSGNDCLLAVTSGERLGIQIPLDLIAETVFYEPAALIVVDERGYPDDPLHLLVESGETEYATQIDTVMRTCWVFAVNRVGCFGRWAFLRLKGDARSQTSQLDGYLDELTRPESKWDYI